MQDKQTTSIHVPRQNCRHTVGKLEACLAERCSGSHDRSVEELCSS